MLFLIIFILKEFFDVISNGQGGLWIENFQGIKIAFKFSNNFSH